MININIKYTTQNLLNKKDSDYYKMFIYLAVKSDKEGLIYGSRNTISKELKLSDSKCERILNFLKSEQLIEQVERKKTRVLKVLYKELSKKSGQKSEQVKTLFSSIKTLEEFRENFEGNKQYLTIAYGFWKLWKLANPKNISLDKMEVNTWIDEIDKLVRIDKQSIERLISIYCYFKMVKENKSGYRDFWFKTIKSVAAFRKKDKAQMLYVEKIMDEVNDKREQDVQFMKMVENAIAQIKQL